MQRRQTRPLLSRRSHLVTKALDAFAKQLAPANLSPHCRSHKLEAIDLLDSDALAWRLTRITAFLVSTCFNLLIQFVR